VGLEFFIGQSISDDEVDEFNLDIGQHWAAYGTFSQDLGLGNLAFNLGYGSTELDSKSATLNSEISETIEGFSFGVSYYHPTGILPNLDWTIDCTRYFSENKTSMDGCGLGVKYDF